MSSQCSFVCSFTLAPFLFLLVWFSRHNGDRKRIWSVLQKPNEIAKNLLNNDLIIRLENRPSFYSTVTDNRKKNKKKKRTHTNSQHCWIFQVNHFGWFPSRAKWLPRLQWQCRIFCLWSVFRRTLQRNKPLQIAANRTMDRGKRWIYLISFCIRCNTYLWVLRDEMANAIVHFKKKNSISIAITVFTRQDYERLLWIFIWIGKGKTVSFIFSTILAAPSFDYDPLLVFYEANEAISNGKACAAKLLQWKLFFVDSFFWSSSEYIFLWVLWLFLQNMNIV